MMIAKVDLRAILRKSAMDFHGTAVEAHFTSPGENHLGQISDLGFEAPGYLP